MAATNVRGGQILDASVSLTVDVTGVLPIANGGTNTASLPTGLLKGAGTGAITAATVGTDYGSPDATFNAATATLTNKRITPRVVSVSNTTSWTINSDTTDFAENTGLTGAVTINNPSGTPTQGQPLWITLTGTAARAISYGTAFEDSTIVRPTTTSGTNALDIGFRWNSVTSKWRCVAYA